MAQLFREHPEEIAATVEIAEHCTFALEGLSYEFPRPNNLPEGKDPYDVLVEAVWAGAWTYYQMRITTQLQERITHELKIVMDLKLAGYLLDFKDIVDFCHRERILVSVRVCAASSCSTARPLPHRPARQRSPLRAIRVSERKVPRHRPGHRPRGPRAGDPVRLRDLRA
jgi:hypothetical protein